MKKPIMITKIIACVLVVMTVLFSITGCGIVDNTLNEMNGTIKGNTYNATFYSNDGIEFMSMSGKKINMSANVVKEPTYVDGSWGYTETMSSVVTVTIDGKEIQSCGSTMIFAEDKLNPDVNFKVSEINSTSDKLSDNVIIAKTVNKYKNYFGKSRVVVIQSQLGDPICAYSGDEVYWEVCKKLPKTTKLMIDGKALYIHRANFQIIDKSLLK